MANRTNQNFLSYTKLTYAEILDQINSRLRDDPRFVNFRESAIAKTMLEIFTAATDLTNYYVERRAEENYMDTAQLKSSVILLAKQLGYVVTRPIPAQTSYSMTIQGPLPTGLVADQDKIIIQKYNTSFTFNGFNFISKDTYSYTFTSQDLAQGVGNPDFVKVIDASVLDTNGLELNSQGNVPTSATSPIQLIQGDLTIAEFRGDDPESQRGNIFQNYKINDNTFSNLYGDQDLGFDQATGVFNLSEDITQVGIGLTQSAAFEPENLYTIDRRSLLTSEIVLDSTSVSANIPQVCNIRTMQNEGVEILFGDGNIAKKGPITVNDNLYVRYLSTDGANANQVGVIGEKIQPNQPFRASVSNVDISGNLTFRLNQNILYGAALEDIESIKVNSPQIYYSLDRLVSSRDYIAYLKSLTSPLNVKNAIAWGEQEEIESGLVSQPGIPAIKKLFNIVLFSVAGSLYEFPPGGQATAKSLSADGTGDVNSVFLEGDQITNFSDQTLFNLYVTGDQADCPAYGVVDEIGKVQSYPPDFSVNQVINNLKRRAQITIRHIYNTPIIHQFALVGDVYAQKLTSLTQVRNNVNNELYESLDLVNDFNQPIYLSNLIQVVEEFKEVLNANVYLEALPSTGPTVTGPISDEPEISSIIDPTQRQFITDVYNSNLAAYTSGDSAIINVTPTSSTSLDIAEFSEINLSQQPWNKSSDWVVDQKAHYRYGGISERTFYFELMKNIWEELGAPQAGGFRNSDSFKTLMYKLNNTLKLAIRNGMLDGQGNITNYSLRNELVQVIIQTNFKYRT